MPTSEALRQAFDQLPTGVLICDLQGTVLHLNPRGRQILSLDGAMQGVPVELVFAPVATLRAAADGPPDDRHTLQCRTCVGPPRPLGFSATYGEHWAPLVVMFRDLTAVVAMREERDRLLRLALVGDIMPAVLHELRNPLAAVTGALENLLDEAYDDEALTEHLPTLSAMLHELNRMGLAFQGIGSVGRSLRSNREHAMDFAVTEACRIMGPRAKRHGVTLDCRIAAMPPLPIDPSVTRAVVFNLVNNAIQACSPGDSIHVSLALDRRRVTLTVRDTGPGMSDEVREKCLRPFYTTRPNGSGLGLVICREAAEEAGGALLLDTRIGEGTTINVVLPIPDQESDADAYN